MKESLSLSEAVVCKCPINKLLLRFCQSSLATLIKKRIRHRCISINLAKFLKNLILQNTCKWLVLDVEQFCQFQCLNVSFHNCETVRKEIIIIWMYSTGFQHRKTTSKIHNCIQKCNFLLYFLQKSSTQNYSVGQGSRHEMNEWMKIFILLRVG